MLLLNYKWCAIDLSFNFTKSTWWVSDHSHVRGRNIILQVVCFYWISCDIVQLTLKSIPPVVQAFTLWVTRAGHKAAAIVFCVKWLVSVVQQCNSSLRSFFAIAFLSCCNGSQRLVDKQYRQVCDIPYCVFHLWKSKALFLRVALCRCQPVYPTLTIITFSWKAQTLLRKCGGKAEGKLRHLITVLRHLITVLRHLITVLRYLIDVR